MVEANRVVDHIVGYLAATGITHIFGVDGANIEDLYDAAHFRDDITAVLAKHEFSAATMADGYSRSGGGVGVVAATSGGGCLNTVPGLAESLASRVHRAGADNARRPGRLPGHQRGQRKPGRACAVLGGLAVLPQAAQARRHPHRASAGVGRRALRWPGGVVAAQGYSASRCGRARSRQRPDRGGR